MDNKLKLISVPPIEEQFDEIIRVFNSKMNTLSRLRTVNFLQINVTAMHLLLTLFYVNRSLLGECFSTFIRTAVFFLVGWSFGLISSLKKKQDALHDLTLGAVISLYTNKLDLNDYTMPDPIRRDCRNVLRLIDSGEIQIKQISTPNKGETDDAGTPEK